MNHTAWAAAAAAVFLTGCAGYRLGSTLPPDLRTVHVPPFVNRVGEPQLDSAATRATIQEFQRDGNLRLADADLADAVLRVTLTGFELEPLRYDRDQSKTAREYRLRITAELTLQRRGAAGPEMQRRVQGETTFDFAGDLSSAKQRALPDAARDLAHQIVSAVVEYW